MAGAAFKEEVAQDTEMSQEELESRQAERELETVSGEEAAAYFSSQDFNCWGQDHKVRMCPSLLGRFCWNCGWKNILVSDCSRCEDSYRRRVLKGVEDPLPGVSDDGESVEQQPFVESVSIEGPVVIFDQLSLDQVSGASQPSRHSGVESNSFGINLLQEFKELEQLLEGLPPEMMRETTLH